MNLQNSLTITPVKTRIFRAQENLLDFILQSLPSPLTEKSILAVTSKIVSLSEGRLAPQASISKLDLIRQESDQYLGEIGFGCHLTIKHGLLISTAGIDESNSQTGDYILFPEDPFQSAKNLWTGLRSKFGLKDFGILLTDSRTSPLRKGVSGISLAHFGFQAVNDFVGTEDLFARPLKMTAVNVADSLACAATLMMGEGPESQPLCLIQALHVKFTNTGDPTEVQIPWTEDLYFPLLQRAKNRSQLTLATK